MPMPEAIVTVPNNKITLQDSIEEAKISGKFTELIQGFLRRQIIAQQAQQLGIEATAQELQVAADLLRKNQKLDTAEATLKWLKINFLSVDDFEKIVIHKLITEKLAQHLFGDRVEHYFHQNTLEYGGATIYEVVLDNRELAMEIFYSLQEGDLNFADVAHQSIAILNDVNFVENIRVDTTAGRITRPVHQLGFSHYRSARQLYRSTWIGDARNLDRSPHCRSYLILPHQTGFVSNNSDKIEKRLKPADPKLYPHPHI